MATNKYFNFFQNQSEQSLLDGLMNETIAMYGINCIYLKRSGPVNIFYGEDPLAKFDRWFEVAAYIKSADGFAGKATLQKWGITMEQSITVQIGKSAFTQAVKDELSPINRPREGDLLYFPYGLPGQYLLEIKYVTDNVPFSELGRDYLYEIDCRMFTYGNEQLNTGLPEIDKIEDELKQNLIVDFIDLPGTTQFLPGEVVYQGSSFVNAKFKAVIKDVKASTLELSNMTGNLDETKSITGNSSGITRALGQEQEQITNDSTAQNQVIRTKSDSFIIKNSRNPFDKGRL